MCSHFRSSWARSPASRSGWASTAGFLLLAAATAAALLAIARAGHCAEIGRAAASPAPQSDDAKVRHWFQLPTLLDFERYQKIYRKSYRSASERAARLGLYMGRACRVFAAALQYKRHRSNYYLSINAHSDRSPEELDALANRLVEPLAEATPLELNQVGRGAPAGSESPPEAEDLEQGEEWQAHRRGPPPLAAGPDGDTGGSWSARDMGARAQASPDYKPLDMVTVAHGRSRHYDHLPNPGHQAKLSAFSLASMARNLKRHLMHGDKATEARASVASGVGSGHDHDHDQLWVDHRRSGCLAPVQDQGPCGACYAFATLAYLEWAHCRETGRLVKFSEQYLVDCGGQRVRGLNGCAHGLVTQVGVFVNNFGLETAASYGRPYEAQAAQCPFAPDTPLGSMGSVRLDMLAVTRVPLEFVEEILEDGPLVVNIGTSRELYEYGGGVFDGRGCSRSGHHSVLLIGHGRENGQEYWLLRNSESAAYGEAGHLKLNKNSDCITPRTGFMFGRYTKGRGVSILPSENRHRAATRQQRRR